MKRSKFSLSHYKLLSLNQGPLVPVSCIEVLPGDSFRMASSMLIRVTPLANPVMHPVHATIHHWFVPYRLLWESWEDFITGGPNNDDDSEFPTISSGAGFAVGSLADYLGLPVNRPGLEVSALPFRAYAKIFNEWYRDQDLVSPLAMSDADGPDSITNQLLAYRAWEKDYLTSARLTAQKGPEVSIPIGGGTVPVEFSGSLAAHNHTITLQSAGGQPPVLVGLQTDNNNQPLSAGSAGTRTGITGIQNANVGLGTLAGEVDLSDAPAVGINDLREAFALQRYAEARARYGSRYSEYLRYIGVKSSDARLQRPEYLGGGKQTLQFSEVLQTTPVDGRGVGNLAGHGIGALRSNRFIRFFEEHGVILSLLSVKPRTMYFQGIPRQWSRRTKEDFFQVELQHIGQQQILNKEVFASGAASGSWDPEGVFGYQDRYDEYRRQESQVAGEMRTLLKDWHMAREFAAPPVLNGSFVTASPTDRVYQTSEVDQLQVMVMHSIQARRLLSPLGNSYIY
jgi:hypothetical protein